MFEQLKSLFGFGNRCAWVNSANEVIPLKKGDFSPPVQQEEKEEDMMSDIDIIAELKQKGCKVFVNHYRSYRGIRQKLTRQQYNKLVKEGNVKLTYAEAVRGNGGKTIVTIQTPNGEFSGEAVCSNSDNFCRAEGRFIALDRCLTNNTIQL